MRMSDGSSDVCSSDLIWWNGEGAAHVLAHDGYALLLERTNGSISLAELARTGHDDEASRIICSVVLQPRDIRVLHGDIHHFNIINPCHFQIGRASCRERVCQYV